MPQQKIEIAPSILTADFGALRSQIEEVTAASGWCIKSIDYEVQLK